MESLVEIRLENITKQRDGLLDACDPIISILETFSYLWKENLNPDYRFDIPISVSDARKLVSAIENCGARYERVIHEE